MARPRSEDKRQAILLAATRLYAEEGLSASTARIAKEAGIAIGSLFTYFPTKEDLENQLYLTLKGQLREALSPIPPSQDLKDQVLHAWRTYVHWGLSHPRERLALSKLTTSPALSEDTRAQAREVFCEVSRLLEKARGTGVLREQPLAFAEALMGSMAEATIEIIRSHPKNEAEMAQAGFRCFWNALTVD